MCVCVISCLSVSVSFKYDNVTDITENEYRYIKLNKNVNFIQTNHCVRNYFHKRVKPE